MIVYWSGCFLSAAAAYICITTTFLKKHKWLTAVISALPMMVIAGLRYDVGRDYLFTYVPYFESLRQSMSVGNAQMEPLFHLLNLVIVRLHGSYVWVFISTAIIFYSFVYERIFEDSPYPLLSIFLIVGMCYCFVFFNAMRQMVGCSILLFSVQYIRKHKFLPFLLCVAIASGFHKSCAVFLVMYWIGRIKLRPKWALIITAALICLSPVVAALIRWIVSLTPYAVYLLSAFDTGETAYVMLAINGVLLIFMSVCYRNNAEYQKYYNIQICAFLVTVFSGQVPLLLRFLWMFGLPSVISLPMAVGNISLNKRDKKLAISVIMILYFAYMVYTVGIQNSNDVLPYKTIMEQWF